MLTTVAPAKINLTLEVLGRREDGFHEIRSVMQTVDLHDELALGPPTEGPVAVKGTGLPRSDDLVARAATAVPNRGGEITVRKSIPVGSGLGGGSSDAAATLRLLRRRDEVGNIDHAAARIGSDVTFFLTGGCAVASGRGEDIDALPSPRQAWLVLVVPPIAIEDKTRRMYECVTSADFSDGSATERAAAGIRQGSPLHDHDLVNVFEHHAYSMFEGLSKYRDWLLEAGASRVHLSGAGPALFAITSGEEEARAMRARLIRPKMGEKVFVVRTIGSDEATLTWDS
jgi:4-diphosphocytidyl-2-C-methyl-D-erythritol kinase